MASKTFYDYQPPNVDAAWLNDVDNAVYHVLGNTQSAATLRTFIHAVQTSDNSLNDIRVGLLSNRPAAGTANRLYIATDNPQFIYFDNGASWVALSIDPSNVNITGGSVTGITDLAVADGGTGASTAANARTNLGLGSIAIQNSGAVTITGGSVSGITDLALADGGTGASTAVNARTNLGLGSIATQSSASVNITGGSVTGITDLALADGGTGASTAANARTNLGLGTAATHAATDFATAAQGSLASSALQPGTSLSVGNTISTTGTSLTLEETGDVDGISRLELLNRNGANGALFTNPSLGLIDFMFNTSANDQWNIRLEQRSHYVNSGNTTHGELQIGNNTAGLGTGALLVIGYGYSHFTSPLNVQGTLTQNGSPVLPANGNVALTGALNFSGNQIDNYTERAAPQVVNNSGTYTIDFNNGRFFPVLLSSNATIAFSHFPTTGIISFTIEVHQNATGGYSITWPTGTTFAGGTAPTPSSAANAIDTYVGYSPDQGTTIRIEQSAKGWA